MKQNSFLKKALTLVGAAVIAGAVGLGAGVGVHAADADATPVDTGAKTTIVLTKYAVSKDTTVDIQHDLTEQPTTDKDVVENATFTAYDVTDQYWEKVDANTLTGDVDTDSQKMNEPGMFTTSDDLKVKSDVTNNKGQIEFTDLANYNAAGKYKVYLFHEDHAPAGYTESPDFVISLPAKDTKGNVLTTAYVYPKDEVVGSYQLKFTKIDANNDQTKLGGAIFYIKNGDKYAQVNGVKGQDENGKDLTLKGFNASQSTVKWVDKDEATKFESGDDGTFGFAAATETVKDGVKYGLNEETEYTIEEETAPKGYNKDADILKDDDLSVKVESLATDSETAEAPAGYTVTDTPEGILPHTGGAGIIAIVVAGLAITAIGVVAYSKRRANA